MRTKFDVMRANRARGRASGVAAGLDDNLRAMVDDPPRFERHWEFGQAIFLAKWSDAAARAVGNRVLTVLFAAIVAAMLTWAALKGGRQ